MPTTWAAPLAVAAGLLAFWFLYRLFASGTAPPGADDFTAFYWRHAHGMLEGRSPYGGPVPFHYPLASVIFALPFVPLDPGPNVAAFMAVGTAAMVYAGLRVLGWWSLTLLVSPAFVDAYLDSQWAMLIAAGALLPAIGWVGYAKPNLGVAAFAYRPSWWTVGGVLVLTLVSFAIEPGWLVGWLRDIGAIPGRPPTKQYAPHTPPLVWSLGWLGLAGLLRWRTPEGRVLAASTLMPATAQLYDHLLVWLAMRGWKESLALSLCAWLGYIAFVATAPHDLTKDASPAQLSIGLSVYVPAALMVLRHPNVGSVPESLERLVARWPRWMRGRAAELGRDDSAGASHALDLSESRHH